MYCALENTTGTMSSNDQPVFSFGNQPGAQANGAAQQGDGFDNAAIDTPAPELLATQETQNATAAQPSAAATPQHQQSAASSQQPTTLSAEAENRIVERLMSTLQSLGITQQQPATPAAPNSQPEAQPQPEPALPEAEQDPWADGQDPWNRQNWGWSAQDWEQSSWKQYHSEDRDRPYLSHLDFPTFNGDKEDYPNYKYIVTNLKAQCGPRDHKYLAPRLISNFKGAFSDDVRSMELNSAEYQTPDGVERLLAFIKKRLNIRELDLETEVFKKYFDGIVRRRGETLIKYIHAEEQAYRKLQRTLKEAMEGGHDEWSSDEEPNPRNRKFKMPKRLRGFLFLERAQLPLKEHSGILNLTQGLNIDRLKR